MCFVIISAVTFILLTQPADCTKAWNYDLSGSDWVWSMQPPLAQFELPEMEQWLCSGCEMFSSTLQNIPTSKPWSEQIPGRQRRPARSGDVMIYSREPWKKNNSHLRCLTSITSAPARPWTIFQKGWLWCWQMTNTSWPQLTACNTWNSRLAGSPSLP